MRLNEDEKNLLLSERLKVPFKNYYHDKKAAIELLTAFMKLGFEISIYYQKKDNSFKVVSFNPDLDRYCPSISGNTWVMSVVNCIYHRVTNGPHGNLFK